MSDSTLKKIWISPTRSELFSLASHSLEEVLTELRVIAIASIHKLGYEQKQDFNQVIDEVFPG